MPEAAVANKRAAICGPPICGRGGRAIGQRELPPPAFGTQARLQTSARDGWRQATIGRQLGARSQMGRPRGAPGGQVGIYIINNRLTIRSAQSASFRRRADAIHQARRFVWLRPHSKHAPAGLELGFCGQREVQIASFKPPQAGARRGGAQNRRRQLRGGAKENNWQGTLCSNIARPAG